MIWQSRGVNNQTTHASVPPKAAVATKACPTTAFTNRRSRPPTPRATSAPTPIPNAANIRLINHPTYAPTAIASVAATLSLPAIAVSTKPTAKPNICSKKGQTASATTCRGTLNPARRPVTRGDYPLARPRMASLRAPLMVRQVQGNADHSIPFAFRKIRASATTCHDRHLALHCGFPE